MDSEADLDLEFVAADLNESQLHADPESPLLYYFMGLVNFSRLFPIILIVCNASASACYAVSGDFRRALYWAASTICVGAVTF